MMYLISLERTGSTNRYLLDRLATEMLPEGTVVLARDQYAGQGQQGNTWQSEAGKNLTFSILFRPAFLQPSAQFLLNMAVSLGTIDYLNTKGIGKHDLSIKWPNDIYIGNKKTGGILLQNAVAGNRILYTVAGIGLNLMQEIFPPDLPNPTSVFLETGLQFYPAEEISEIVKFLMERYHSLREGLPDELRKDYHQYLYRRGVPSPYKVHDELITATITGVEPDGRLQLETEGKKRIFCDVKEVEYLSPKH